MKKLFDNFGAVLGSLTVCLLVISVVHEYGYFWVVGREFQTFLTTGDYLANGVLWLPLTLIILIGISWDALKEKKNPPSKPDWKKWQTWIAPTLFGAFFVFTLVTSTWPPHILSIYSWALVAIYIWSRVWQRIYRPLPWLDDEILASMYRRALQWVPPLLFLVFLIGMGQATSELGERNSNGYLVQFKNIAQPQERQLLRSFANGVLLRNPETSKIEFERWENVLKLEVAPLAPSTTILCKFFDYCVGDKRDKK